MTRFVYIADTHLGADPVGYCQQPAYPEKLDALVRLLDAWIRERGDIDFLLHGGDMVDAATAANITAARRLFDLSMPTFLCLGNHDLTAADALDLWMRLATDFFPGQEPDYAIVRKDCVVHVTPNHWEDAPYRWLETQDPHFAPGQLDAVERTAAERPDAVHVFATHCAVIGAPPEQTGLDEPWHAPSESFANSVFGLARRIPRLCCALSGHTHVNTHVKERSVHFVTASAFCETPFDFKLIEVGLDAVRMSTHNLAARVDFRAEYDYDKTFVQGRATDRAFEEAATEPVRETPQGGQ